MEKGERAEFVIFSKCLEVNERLDNETTERKEAPFLRYYHVFNVGQSEGLKHPALESVPERESHPIGAAEAIINNDA